MKTLLTTLILLVCTSTFGQKFMDLSTYRTNCEAAASIIIKDPQKYQGKEQIYKVPYVYTSVISNDSPTVTYTFSEIEQSILELIIKQYVFPYFKYFGIGSVPMGFYELNKGNADIWSKDYGWNAYKSITPQYEITLKYKRLGSSSGIFGGPMSAILQVSYRKADQMGLFIPINAQGSAERDTDIKFYYKGIEANENIEIRMRAESKKYNDSDIISNVSFDFISRDNIAINKAIQYILSYYGQPDFKLKFLEKDRYSEVTRYGFVVTKDKYKIALLVTDEHTRLDVSIDISSTLVSGTSHTEYIIQQIEGKKIAIEKEFLEKRRHRELEAAADSIRNEKDVAPSDFAPTELVDMLNAVEIEYSVSKYEPDSWDISQIKGKPSFISSILSKTVIDDGRSIDSAPKRGKIRYRRNKDIFVANELIFIREKSIDYDKCMDKDRENFLRAILKDDSVLDDYDDLKVIAEDTYANNRNTTFVQFIRGKGVILYKFDEKQTLTLHEQRKERRIEKLYNK